MRRVAWKSIAVILMASTALTACEGAGQNQQIGTIAGAGAGAAIGAAIGSQRGGTEALVGALLGAVIGGVIGGMVGKAFDDRNKRLSELSQASGVPITAKTFDVAPANRSEQPSNNQTIEQARQNTVYASTVPDMEFAPGSGQLTPSGRVFFENMADAYSREGKRKVLIVGHTDDSGNAAENQQLSEARALAVARVFQERGFNPDDLYYQGAGSAEPIADNATAEGRAKNRRVEVADGANEEALLRYKQIALAESKKVQSAESAPATARQPFQNETEVPAPPVAPPAATPSGPAVAPQAGKIVRPSISEVASIVKRPVDFGGVPWDGDTAQDFGAQGFNGKPPSSTLSYLAHFIAPAAAATPVPTFLNDQVNSAGTIKSLANGKPISIKYSDVSPGYFRQPFYAQVERHFVDVSPVTIWKAGDVAEAAAFDLYLDYDRTHASTPTAKIPGASKIYQSSTGFLYRWKADPNDFGVIGVEIRSPKLSSDQAATTKTIQAPSRIWYVKDKQVFVRDIDLRADIVAISIKGGL